jgi:class 3 adenylate cyclase/DNA-binding transcriptional MerR regulator
MLNSKDLLSAGAISRGTLNNYIKLGLIPKPVVKRTSIDEGRPLTTLGYFPEWVLTRIYEIRKLKQEGMSIDHICKRLLSYADQKELTEEEAIKSNAGRSSYESATVNVLDKRISVENKAPHKLKSQESITLSIDTIPHPAYMINYNFELVWLNEAAQKEFFLDTSIPDRAKDRTFIPNLLDWSTHLSLGDKSKLMEAHLYAIKARLTQTTLEKVTSNLDLAESKFIEHCYAQATNPESTLIQECLIQKTGTNRQRIIIISFREGVLFTYIPEKDDSNHLLEWLSQRDSVIHTLLRQTLPVLTPMAAMVADLQNSVRICSELPPNEYFQLINEIWSTLEPIFREYYGAYGKHTGDGMVYYFFPNPDCNYLMNAILCACKIRETMKKISNDWAHKKGWTNQLFMNIGLSEGEEWLGTFKTNTSYELVVLGETINVGARLSELARFGQVWSTKSLVSKLTAAELEKINYGVTRKGLEQDVFVPHSFVQVSTLVNQNDPKYAKLMDISSAAITEIQGLK